MVVSAVVPWPPDQGDRARLDAILQVLEGRHQVTLAVPRAVPPPSGRAVRVVALPGAERRPGRLLLHPGDPVTRAWRRSALARAGVAARMAQADVTLFYQLAATAWLPAEADPATVFIDLTDALSLYYFRRFGATRNPFWLVETLRARRVERQLVDRYRVSVVAEADRAFLAGRFHERVVVAGNGGWPPPPGFQRAPVPGRVVAVGNWRYPPNRRGLLRFVRHSWPRVREGFAGAELWVVGKAPPAALQRVAGVRAVGAVDEVAPYYRTAALAVAPIWEGSGTKTKVLGALCHGVAVVTTPMGAVGIPPQPLLHIAPDDVGLADLVLKHLADHDCGAVTPAAELLWPQALRPLLAAMEGEERPCASSS